MGQQQGRLTRLIAASVATLGVRAFSTTPQPHLRKQNLYGLSDEGLHTLLAEWNQPKFRLKQIRGFMYGENPVETIEQMHTLPKTLRSQLAAHTTLGEMEIAHEQQSKDGTQKRLWRCHDESLIESVLMPYSDNRRTACISSQVGCAMGCTFCATGQMGFTRDLSEAEIFEQAARFAAELRARRGCRTSCSWAWASRSGTTMQSLAQHGAS